MTDAEFTESNAPRPHEQTEGVAYDELRVDEIRVKIAAEVGLNTTPRSPMSKRELNSIFAYLDGRWVYPPRLHGTEKSPPVGAVRREVARKVGLDEYPIAGDSRQFRKMELVEIHKELTVNADSRPAP